MDGFFHFINGISLLLKWKRTKNLAHARPRLNIIPSECVEIPPYAHIPKTRPSRPFNQWQRLIKEALVLLPEREHQQLLNRLNILMLKYDKLKIDVATFQKNMALQEDKAKRLFQNQFYKRIIPVLDDLFRASRITSALKKNKDINAFIGSISVNLTMILNSFMDVTGLQLVLPPVGSLFDEKLEKVVDVIYSRKKKPNILLDVIKPGYLFHGDLLRHAEIVVSSQESKNGFEKEEHLVIGKKTRWFSFQRRRRN
nr:nucleotide exchange factor GrpE [Candidatus Sigynarchaeota archaeon]